MSNIYVNNLGHKAVPDQRLEIVERKGLGHPDSMCDAIMNQISVNMSKRYIQETGTVLHHNFDKSFLAAGESHTWFGGGERVQPMELLMGDRATSIPDAFSVDDEAKETVINWVKENMPNIDPCSDIKVTSKIKKGSASLQDIFTRIGEGFLPANDTSAAVGFAPLSPTENLVLNLEHMLNSPTYQGKYPMAGQDVKIMACRNDEHIQFTIAQAMVSRYIAGEEEYFSLKKDMRHSIQTFLDKATPEEYTTGFRLNALDRMGREESGCYLTRTGTSADSGDSGQVGRGNNVVGVIPLNRPMSSEAAAGKNPVSHVGKIYNILSYHLAQEICKEVDSVKEVYVWLLSTIGDMVDSPQTVSVQYVPGDRFNVLCDPKRIQHVIEYEMSNLGGFIVDLVNGKYSVC